MDNNGILKFPLDKDEMDVIDKVWEFLEIFKMNYIFVSEYREHVIEEVNKNYSIDEFYTYETILNKMFWSIRYIVAVLMIFKMDSINDLVKEVQSMDELPNSFTLCDKVKYSNDEELKRILDDNFVVKDGRYSHYRSFINKLIIVDKSERVVWFKNMEGSADIFSKNHFNLYTMTILFNKDLYTAFMKDPIEAINRKIKLSDYYFQYDYPFPNMNFCSYSIGSEDDKRLRIEKMYYDSNKTDSSRNWHKIIY